MNKKVPKITESVEEIKSLMKCSAQSYQKQRLFMLYHLQSGQAKNRKQVADLLGVHRTTIGNWLSSYETGGLEIVSNDHRIAGRLMFIGFPAIVDEWVALGSRASSLRNDAFSDKRV